MKPKSVVILRPEFLNKFPDFPEHMHELGMFVYLRTYSRFLPHKGRRETWKETCIRSITYNVGLAIKHMEGIGRPYPLEDMQEDAEKLFEAMFNLEQFLSGRTLWVGGASSPNGKSVSDLYGLANFNCSFLTINNWSALAELFYLLMVGTGVGFRCTKELANGLKPIRNNVKILHSDYNPLPKNERIERTQLHNMGNGYAKIWIGDSKEGWSEALATFLEILTEQKYEDIHTVKISYNSIRPKGERLNTFGGYASGHEPLKEMFEGFVKVINNEIDQTLEPPKEIRPGYVKLRPIHILDMGNLIGNNVVVGGVKNRLAPH